ncbi:unnamed protein product [Cuscuta epithymum]|uniref:Uncharacterized protein n=1 Tax=Cuscuta epithymum TaxID=186058 RepID=A0AAV0EH28_9ASTE|nr:unnamed protein product [Cuscuta epithymum]
MLVAAQPSSMQQLQLASSSSIIWNSFTPSPLHPRRLYIFRRRIARPSKSSDGTAFEVKSYMDDSNSVSGLVKKVVGSLPVIGLIVRIASGEGGIGGDLIDFAEFRRRVGKKCSVSDSIAFYDFQDRRGRVIFLSLHLKS